MRHKQLLIDDVSFWMHLAHNRARAQADAVLAKSGVSPEQWTLLVQLWQEADRTATDLAAAILRDKPSVTRLLDGLVRSGYVLRANDPIDKRRQRIVLTRAGRELERQLVPRVRAFVKRLSRGVRARDLETTVKILRKVYRNLA